MITFSRNNSEFIGYFFIDLQCDFKYKPINMKNLIYSISCIFIVGVMTLTSSAAWANVYGYSDENGVIHLTDNNEGNNFELIAEEPIIKNEEILFIAEQMTRKPKSSLSNSSNYLLYKKEINLAAQANQIDPNLLHAIIAVESNYNPRAVSSKGAVGLMQLMPSTAKRFGVSNYFDPHQNIQGGAKYLAYLLKLFNNNKQLAVAAYNAGEQAVIRYGWQVPPFRETVGYVAKVNAVY